jgi:hypothetical protein
MISAKQLIQIQNGEALFVYDIDDSKNTKKIPRLTTVFKNSCDLCYNSILSEVNESILSTQTTKDTSITVSIPTKLLKSATNHLSNVTLLYGNYNQLTKSYDKTIFENNKTICPLDLAITYYTNLGYTFENLSDLTNPENLVLKISWT